MSYEIGICRVGGGVCLKSQTVHSDNRESAFGLVYGTGVFQSIWGY